MVIMLQQLIIFGLAKKLLKQISFIFFKTIFFVIFIKLLLTWSEPQKLDTHLTKLAPTDEIYFY